MQSVFIKKPPSQVLPYDSSYQNESLPATFLPIISVFLSSVFHFPDLFSHRLTNVSRVYSFRYPTNLFLIAQKAAKTDPGVRNVRAKRPATS